MTKTCRRKRIEQKNSHASPGNEKEEVVKMINFIINVDSYEEELMYTQNYFTILDRTKAPKKQRN